MPLKIQNYFLSDETVRICERISLNSESGIWNDVEGVGRHQLFGVERLIAIGNVFQVCHEFVSNLNREKLNSFFLIIDARGLNIQGRG